MAVVAERNFSPAGKFHAEDSDASTGVASAGSSRVSTPTERTPRVSIAAQLAARRNAEVENTSSRRRPSSRAGVASNDHGLAAAAAAGAVEEVRRILSMGVSPTEVGPDGTTPLCAAAMWGYPKVIALLLAAGAGVNQANTSCARHTALHAAALQEHGKICMQLLAAGGDPHMQDTEGATPVDYASCSEAVWPHFAAQNCNRINKNSLVEKGVIRKASPNLEQELKIAAANDAGQKTLQGVLPEFSRPGSSYVVTNNFPPRPGSAVPRSNSLGSISRPASRGYASGSRPVSRGYSRPIDIIEETSFGGSVPGAGRQPRKSSKQSGSLVRSGSLACLGL